MVSVDVVDIDDDVVVVVVVVVGDDNDVDVDVDFLIENVAIGSKAILLLLSSIISFVLTSFSISSTSLLIFFSLSASVFT